MKAFSSWHTFFRDTAYGWAELDEPPNYRFQRYMEKDCKPPWAF